MSRSESEWSLADAQQLKESRERAGISATKLARDNCLSMSQLQQLEEGGDGSFYSPAIKRQLGHRLLRQLGCDVPAPPSRHWQMPVPPVPPAAAAAPAHPVWRGGLAAAARISRIAVPWRKLAWTGGAVLLLLGLRSWSLRAPELRPLPLPALNASAPADQPGPAARDTGSPPLLAAAMAAPAASPSPCPEPSQWGNQVAWQPSAASKPASYVHIVAQQAMSACARDSQGVQTAITLDAGASRSVPGSPPWHIFSSDWSWMKLYFQGQLVPAPAKTTTALVLQEYVSP